MCAKEKELKSKHNNTPRPRRTQGPPSLLEGQKGKSSTGNPVDANPSNERMAFRGATGLGQRLTIIHQRESCVN